MNPRRQRLSLATMILALDFRLEYDYLPFIQSLLSLD